jgi:hypothetical protein
VIDPILLQLPSPAVALSSVPLPASNVIWLDFMVSNARTELVAKEHRFDEDLLLFVSYLANRKDLHDHPPEQLRKLIMQYHQQLSLSDEVLPATFRTFIRDAAKSRVSSPAMSDSPSP